LPPFEPSQKRRKWFKLILIDYLYGSFSELIQSTFDEALPCFSENSICLLHIDGLHTYEAVKHDFETWLPKMQKNGIVLFHDISVVQESFGVKRFWNEVKKDFAHFEFYHSSGLGVLALSDPPSPLLGEMIHASEEQANLLRSLFRGVGNSSLEEEYVKLTREHVSIVRSRAWKAISTVKKALRPSPHPQG